MMTPAIPYSYTLYVGLGSALGGMCRFLAIKTLESFYGAGGFPYGTLLVNALGALIIGGLVGWVEKSPISQEIWLFMAMGVLGGFTTFSAFSLESMRMISQGAWQSALLYILSSVVLCIALAFSGMFLVRALGS